MKRTSVKTLILLVELLAVVAVHQSLVWTPSAGAAMVWLDDDPNEPVDPNETNDPQPESIEIASRIWLDDDPNEPVDPNAPGQEADPQPEITIGTPVVWQL